MGSVPGAWRPLGRAIRAYHGGRADAVLLVHREDGVTEEVPVAEFFRAPPELDVWEEEALARARGRVLDVGAGAGAHALALQERGVDVTALEPVPEAAEVLRARGVGSVVGTDLYRFEPDRPFDTALLLMSGSQLAGTLEGLEGLFEALDRVLAPDGAALMDSADLREPGEPAELDDGRYLGELHYQLEFDGVRGPPFPHLFVDAERLEERAIAAGWRSEVVWRGPEGGYLARLSRGPVPPPP